jgi:peptidoglycan hydrolase-like protein with peptidoglycan-binding domain
MPSLRVLIEGRSNLPGPLAQLGLGRDGTCYVIAAGRCNHAGAGLWQGVSTGNSSFIGTEAVVREFQRRNALVPDGILGPKTWALLPQP